MREISELESDGAELQGYFEKACISRCDVSKGRMNGGLRGTTAAVMCDVETVSLGRVWDSSLCSVRLSGDRRSVSHPSRVPL